MILSEQYSSTETIYASVWWNGVYVSTDNGTNWSPAGLNSECVTSFVKYNDNIIAGTWKHGVYVSYDQGTGWESINTGLTGGEVESMALDGDYLYAGLSWNRGVWKRALSEIAPLDVNERDYNLKVYPNPAENEIIIEKTQLNSYETLSVYSSEGKMMLKRNFCGTVNKIDISIWSKGIYLIKTGDREKSEVYKFIKE